MRKLTPLDVKHKLSAMGRTHAAVAHEVGVSRQSVTETLAGRQKHPATRKLICMAARIDPDEVEWGDE